MDKNKKGLTELSASRKRLEDQKTKENFYKS